MSTEKQCSYGKDCKNPNRRGDGWLPERNFPRMSGSGKVRHYCQECESYYDYTFEGAKYKWIKRNGDSFVSIPSNPPKGYYNTLEVAILLNISTGGVRTLHDKKKTKYPLEAIKDISPDSKSSLRFYPKVVRAYIREHQDLIENARENSCDMLAKFEIKNAAVANSSQAKAPQSRRCVRGAKCVNPIRQKNGHLPLSEFTGDKKTCRACHSYDVGKSEGAVARASSRYGYDEEAMRRDIQSKQIVDRWETCVLLGVSYNRLLPLIYGDDPKLKAINAKRTMFSKESVLQYAQSDSITLDRVRRKSSGNHVQLGLLEAEAASADDNAIGEMFFSMDGVLEKLPDGFDDLFNSYKFQADCLGITPLKCVEFFMPRMYEVYKAYQAYKELSERFSSEIPTEVITELERTTT